MFHPIRLVNGESHTSDPVPQERGTPTHGRNTRILDRLGLPPSRTPRRVTSMSLLTVLTLLGSGACDYITAPDGSQPTAISLYPSMALVEEGDLFQLQVRDAGSSEAKTLSGLDIVWESSNPAVASVNGGTVRGISRGEARITAVAPGGARAEATVKVQRTPGSVELRGAVSLEGEVGEALEHPVEVRVLSARGLPVSGAKVRFAVEPGQGEVSPEEVVADEEGMAVTNWTLGTVAGEQRLQISFPDHQKQAPPLLARALPSDPEQITVLPEDVSLKLGSAFHFKAQVSDKYGNKVTEVPVRWFTSDEQVVEIHADGWVTARTSGTATIEAEPIEGAEEAYGDLGLSPGQGGGLGRGRGQVEVESEEAGSEATVEITGGDGQFGAVGELLSEELRIRVTDSRGSPVRQFDVYWTVEDGGGEVSDEVTRTDGQGRASIEFSLGPEPGENRVRARAGGLGSAYFTATGVAEGVTKVVVGPGEAEVEEGQEIQFTAVALDQDGNEVEEHPEPEWSVEDTSVASVNSDGRAKGLAAGTTRVRASIGGVVGMAELEVEAVEGGDGTGDDGSGGDSSQPPPPPVGGLLPAFPGAEGWGATALNECRGLPLRVHKVTNTNDSGSGSLRDILENRVSDSNYDVVVFRTGGTISNRSQQILLRSSCVYVAGQTAPGDGIMVRSHPTSGHNGQLIRVNATTAGRDVVFRFLRLRHGEEGGFGGGGLGLIGSGGARNIIFDHISTSWGGSNAHLQFQRNDQNAAETLGLTMQNSLVAEGIGSRGMMIYGGTGGSAYGFRDISMHRNLMASLAHRYPRIHSGDASVSTNSGIEVVNNLYYNAVNRFGEAHRSSVVDWVGNYIDHGPHRGWRISRWEGEYKDGAYQPLDPNYLRGSLHAEGNEILGFDGPDFESWRDRYDGTSHLPSTYRRSHRLSQPTFSIQQTSPGAARSWILANAGASKKVDCRGDWVSNRDKVDQRIVGYVGSRSSSQTPRDTRGMTVSEINGGWPSMSSGSACKDSDGDGLPDAWEERYFGCTTCADPGAMTPSGYLVIEHYVNGTKPN
jgi:hypothetical protein